MVGLLDERNASMLPASRSSHRWSSWLLLLARHRPGPRRLRRQQARRRRSIRLIGRGAVCAACHRNGRPSS